MFAEGRWFPARRRQLPPFAYWRKMRPEEANLRAAWRGVGRLPERNRLGYAEVDEPAAIQSNYLRTGLVSARSAGRRTGGRF
jgi:hypothetical protein